MGETDSLKAPMLEALSRNMAFAYRRIAEREGTRRQHPTTFFRATLRSWK